MKQTQILWTAALGTLFVACGQAAQLEPPVRLSGASPVEYPRKLWDLGIEGETIVAARVTESGTVERARVYHSSGYAAFDSAAVAGALALRFAPAREGDQRVDMWVRLPVRFRKQHGSGSSSERAEASRVDARQASGGGL